MHLLRLLPLFALGACATDGGTKDDGVAGTDGSTVAAGDPVQEAEDGPSAYEPELPDLDAATFSQDAVETAIGLIVRSLDTLEFTPVFDGYDAAMARGEGYCPAYYEQNGNVFWYADCTTSAGTWFDGYAFYNYYEGYMVDGDGNIWDTEYISGAATVREDAGETFHVGGYVQRAWSEDENGYVMVQENLLGSFLDDTAPADTWLGRGEMPSLTAYSSVHGEGGYEVGGYRGWAGSLGGLGDDGLTAMASDQLIIATESLGIPCQTEPNGTLSVRTPDGGWWDVTFDMDPESWRLTGDCDGCGTVTDSAGNVVGEACADFSLLLD